MNIYIYCLKPSENQITLTVNDVIETSKMYKSKKIMLPIYKMQLRKSDDGKLFENYGDLYLFTDHRDDDFAVNRIKERLNGDCKALEEELYNLRKRQADVYENGVKESGNQC